MADRFFILKNKVPLETNEATWLSFAETEKDTLFVYNNGPFIVNTRFIGFSDLDEDVTLKHFWTGVWKGDDFLPELEKQYSNFPDAEQGHQLVVDTIQNNLLGS